MFSNLELEQQLNHLEVLIVNGHQQRGPAWVTRLKNFSAVLPGFIYVVTRLKNIKVILRLLKTIPAKFPHSICFFFNTYIKRLDMSGLTTKRVNAVNVDQARLLL